jgi:hypothetical protein
MMRALHAIDVDSFFFLSDFFFISQTVTSWPNFSSKHPEKAQTGKIFSLQTDSGI